MNRTKILTTILCILIIMLCIVVFIKKYDLINTYIDEIKSMLKGNTVDVPNTKENNLSYNFITVKETDNFFPSNMDDIKSIYYTVLNNRWNHFTFYCSKDYSDCLNDIKDFAHSDNELSLLNNYVSPYNSYKLYNTAIEGDAITLSIEYLYTEEEISILKNKVNSIIELLSLDKNNIDINSIRLVHKYIIDNTTYDDNYTKDDIYSVSNKAYGSLIKGNALCSGYSDAFAIILNELNIPNFKVSSEEHVWNAIYFNNTWSHIDVTWDDDEKYESNTYNFFMIDTNKLYEKDTTKHTFNQNLYLELQ